MGDLDPSADGGLGREGYAHHLDQVQGRGVTLSIPATGWRQGESIMHLLSLVSY